jgi:hypothetical protein
VDQFRGTRSLLAAVEDQWEPLEGKIRERDHAALRERLGAEFDRLHAEGLAMPSHEIIKLALAVR